MSHNCAAASMEGGGTLNAFIDTSCDKADIGPVADEIHQQSNTAESSARNRHQHRDWSVDGELFELASNFRTERSRWRHTNPVQSTLVQRRLALGTRNMPGHQTRAPRRGEPLVLKSLPSVAG